jgi:NADH:ubiquinone oxidoreductase subunit
MSLFSRFITAWRHARLPWRTRVYIGSDHLGNEYYESTSKFNGRTKRMVEIKRQHDVIDFISNEIPGND